MGTWGDVARRLREPVHAAILVAAVVVAPLAATLVVSSDASPTGTGSIDTVARGLLVHVPAASPEPETPERQRPILAAAESPPVQARDHRPDASARDPDPLPESEPPGSAPDDPSGPPAEPPAAPEPPPPAPEPPQPPPAEPPARTPPDDLLESVGSTVDGVVEEAEEIVEELPLPDVVLP
jgi:hypothetical protein